jgi:hypothetical protein
MTSSRMLAIPLAVALTACGGGQSVSARDSEPASGDGDDVGPVSDSASDLMDAATKPLPVCRPGTYDRRKDRPTSMDDAHSATVLLDGRLLVAGSIESGFGPINIYDARDDTWMTLSTPLTMHREEHSAALLHDGRVLMVGGQTDEAYESTTAEIVDPHALWPTHASVRVASMKAHRKRARAVTLPSGRVLVGGGYWDDDIPSPPFEIYDPGTDSWTTVNSPDDLLADTGVNTGRSTDRFTMTLLGDGRVLVTGSNIVEDCGRAFLYDEASDTWAATERLPEPVSPSVSALLPDGRVIVTGGTTCTAAGVLWTASAATLVYDPATMHWSNLAPMNVPRMNPSGAAMTCGGFLVAGGAADVTNVWGSWEHRPEYYDVATNQWTLLPVVLGGRDNHVRALPDGTIVLTFYTAVYK